jgi:hypothetical protein
MDFINDPYIGLGLPRPNSGWTPPYAPTTPGSPGAPTTQGFPGTPPFMPPRQPQAVAPAPVAAPAQEGVSFGLPMNYGGSAAQQMATQQDAQNIIAAQQLRAQSGGGGIPGAPAAAPAAGAPAAAPAAGGLDVKSLMKLISMFGAG